ncbi:MAG: signal peptide peptidase SppA [Bacteroidia bacterium]|nr:signal peptide peptidase SppA [Bacteroidia bacterium]
MAQSNMTFGKTFLAALLAFGVVVLTVILLFALSIASMIATSGGGSSKVKVKDKSVLHMKLAGEVSESAQQPEIDLEKLFPGASASAKIGLYQTIQAIRHAKTDDKIKGIYLDIDMVFSGGWASLKALRDELNDFKKSGKFIVSYAQAYTEKSYYIASVSDKIYMTPSGIVEFNGLSYTPMFYTGMFEKLELQPKIYRVGTFKSAVEPYFLKEMSEASEMQVKAFLGDIWNQFAEDVAASRKMSVEEINQLATTFVFGDGNAAVKAKLVDKAAYEDEVKDELKSLSGLDVKDKDEKLRLVQLKKYRTLVSEKNENAKNKIAVIVAEGQINTGKSSDGTIGSATLIEQLRKAREDEKVKAVVLRVNSPGGSALASDEINREVILTKGFKPVVVSMGDLAASGGYYISANSDYIFAEKNTITGSIGIFGVLFNTQKFMNNKLGLTFDEVETHENADFINPNFPSNPLHDSIMQHYVTNGYGDFLKVVQTGRKFADTLSVDKIAQGRVWSGKEALPLKLIDGYGNLDSAIVKAAKLANLTEKDFRIDLVPKAKQPFEDLFEIGSDAMYQKAMAQEPLYEEVRLLREIKKHFPKNGTYALMPAVMNIQ